MVSSCIKISASLGLACVAGHGVPHRFLQEQDGPSDGPSNGPSAAEMDAAEMADAMVDEACVTACPGVRDYFMAMMMSSMGGDMDAPAPGDNETRRMDGHEDDMGMGEMLDMLPMICTHEEALQCMSENAEACESPRRLQKANKVPPSVRRLAGHMGSDMDGYDHDDQDDQDGGMAGMLPMLGLCSSCPNGVCPEGFNPAQAMMMGMADAMLPEACMTACPGAGDYLMAMMMSSMGGDMDAPAPGDNEARRMDGHEDDMGMGEMLNMLPMICTHEEALQCMSENAEACGSPGMRRLQNAITFSPSGRRLAGHMGSDMDGYDHDDQDDQDGGGVMELLPLCAMVASGEDMSQANMWAFMAVRQECEETCSGARAFMSSMLPVISDDWLEMLPLVCENVDVVTCVGENSDGICQMGDDEEEGGFDSMLPFCICQTECPNFMDGMAATGRVTNAMDNATKSDLLCPKESTIRCIAGQSSCTGDASPDEIASTMDILDGCSSVWIPRPLAVAVSMELSVPDPAAFVANPGSKTAVEQGIAEAAGVQISKVVATLSVARRLRQSDRRLQGAVNVDATIEADSADAVVALQASVAAVTAGTMATELNSALIAAGIEATVEVSNLVAEVAPPPQRQSYLADASNTTTTTPTNTVQSESAAFRTTFFGGFLIALATQFSA